MAKIKKTKMVKKYLYVIFVVLCIASSCKMGKDYVRPKYPSADTFVQFTADSTKAADSTTYADMPWWEVYTDTILIELIDTALKNNQDLKIATERVREYMALRRMTVSNLYPSIGADISYGGTWNKNSEGQRVLSNKFEAEATIRWEIDLWGKLRRQKESSTADLMGVLESKHAVELFLIAQVAENYFKIVALNSKLNIVKQTIDARREASRIASLRFIGGLTSEIAYKQAQVELAETQVILPSVEQDIVLQNNELSFLLGLAPSLIVVNSKLEVNSLPDYIPAGLPSTLINRRPDIRESEQDLIVANAGVGIAKAQFFPSLSLTGNIGLQSFDLTNFFRTPVWGHAANLLSPIFQYGKNKGRFEASKAVREQKVLAYQKSILNGFREVSNGITHFQKAKVIRKLNEELKISASTYLKLAQLQYINGVVAYIDVLDAQRKLFEAEIDLNTSIRNEYLSLVSLYKALGGGWSLDVLESKNSKEQIASRSEEQLQSKDEK